MRLFVLPEIRRPVCKADAYRRYCEKCSVLTFDLTTPTQITISCSFACQNFCRRQSV